jgi:S-DNA-T family DNA segregation ATPase FtsK/SpoIIIE
VTLHEVAVSRGVKVETISHIANNLAMELAAVSLRILAPVPGQDYVGIEVPNREPDTVRLGSLIRGDPWLGTRAEIPLAMGRNVHGADVVLDLAKAPHLLVAGATGSGKSVCLNAIILSLLYRFAPEDLRLVLVDPKVVEFRVYSRLPHLVMPVINDVRTVVQALRWLIQEMTHRYRLFGRVGARHLQGFNSRPPDAPTVMAEDGRPVPRHLPRIVLVIDELADIMLTARQDVETSLARIAQMSRAVGIHAVIATQRPSVNIITGVIKANFPTRVAFQVASQVDARTILDVKGAESLLGRGDMLFRPPGTARLQRLQGSMVEDAEIEAVATFASAQATEETDFSLLKLPADEAAAVDSGAAGEAVDEALIRQAMELVQRDRRASTSYLQRRLRIGYNRAASLMDCLEQRGIVGPSLGVGPREILVDAPAAAPESDEAG